VGLVRRWRRGPKAQGQPQECHPRTPFAAGHAAEARQVSSVTDRRARCCCTEEHQHQQERGQGSVEAQEDSPAFPGADAGANRDFGTANQLDRVGEYQQGDVGGNGEGRRGHEADSWQAYAWQGGRNNVCIYIEHHYRCVGNGADGVHRDKLREQNDLSEEIVQAITGNQLGEPVDDMELEDELEAMQQEHLDEQMLKTGNVPTTDAVAHKMPSPAQQEPVPAKKQAVEDDEEAELEKLRAEMAM